MRIVVVGAGIAGLGTSLHLAKAGHDVTLLERDPAPPDDVEEAWSSWERRGVPQSRLAHVFLGRMRNALRDEHPDLYADLLAAGATEIRHFDQLPATMEDRSPRPLDDDLVMLGMRRVALEHHLRRALSALPNLQIRSAAPVDDVLAGTSVADGIPHVVGVRLEDATELDADLVVDCSGRRSPLPQWLAGLGAPTPPEEQVEDGLMYFGRFYRLNDGQSFPTHGSPITDLGYLFALTFEADRSWFAVALAVHSEDKAIRALRDEDAFERALAAIPATAIWRAEGRSTPMSEVKTMSRIDDRWRDLVIDGRPLVTGLVAVGDSLVATNPAFGRGSSLAWVCGRALVDVIAEHVDDPIGLALAQHQETTRLVRAWYDQTAQMDASRLENMRRLLDGEPPTPIDESDPMQAFPIGLQLASMTDPDVFRAFARVAHVLGDPMDIMADEHAITAAIAAFEARDTTTPPAAIGPTRDELLAAMATEGSPAAVG